MHRIEKGDTMPEALSARGRRTQFLGILIVGGLILVALVSAVLWLSVAAGTAARSSAAVRSS